MAAQGAPRGGIGETVRSHFCGVCKVALPRATSVLERERKLDGKGSRQEWEGRNGGARQEREESNVQRLKRSLFQVS